MVSVSNPHSASFSSVSSRSAVQPGPGGSAPASGVIVRRQSRSFEIALGAMGGPTLQAELSRPSLGCRGWVIFAHGSGSSRLSPRNQRVALALNHRGYGTVLMDLLTEVEALDSERVFGIPLLAERLSRATDTLKSQPEWGGHPIFYFGASTGAAAALWAASQRGDLAGVVSRGGRPDLCPSERLRRLRAPVLLIVGGEDIPVIGFNQWALQRLAHARIVLIPGAGHLFEEPGTLGQVIGTVGDWLDDVTGLAAQAA